MMQSIGNQDKNSIAVKYTQIKIINIKQKQPNCNKTEKHSMGKKNIPRKVFKLV